MITRCWYGRPTPTVDWREQERKRAARQAESWARIVAASNARVGRS